MAAKINLTSIENTSVLRKFTIFFLLMSIIPIGLLYYFYLQIKDQGRIEITEENFSITLFLVVLGVLVGYWGMRTILRGLIKITVTSRDALEGVLGQSKMRELASENNEIAVLAKSFNEITSRLEENVKKLEMAKRTLHSVLAKVGRGLSSLKNIDSFLDLIVETVCDALAARVGILLLINKEKKQLYAKSIYGASLHAADKLNISLEEGPFSSVIKTAKPIIIPKLEYDQMASRDQEALFAAPLICSPLVLHNEVIGLLVISGRNGDGGFGEEDLNLLLNLTLQTAVAIENSRLNEDAEKIYFETISALALAVEAKDRYSRGHLDRVAEYATRIAKKLNLSEMEIKILRDGAKLHDVGKIGILDEILKKPAQLTPQEWEMMKKHPEIGESIIKPISSLSKLCDVIRHHHEKLDGSGYPDGLRGEEISLMARILCVADIFDALTTDRPYRPAYSAAEAREELLKMKGKLDPRVVEALLAVVDNKEIPPE